MVPLIALLTKALINIKEISGRPDSLIRMLSEYDIKVPLGIQRSNIDAYSIVLWHALGR